MEKRMQVSEPVEFTYRWYQEFLARIQDEGYDFCRFGDEIGDGDVLLRHDVDLSLTDAVTMAQIEADQGVTATYCVLLTSALYNPVEQAQRERLRKIKSLGHDVALHFSTHEYWDGDEEPDQSDLEARVAEERAVLDTLVSHASSTVSFHAPPEWVLDRRFDGFRNAYAPEYFSDVEYVADSGQRWRETAPSISSFGPAAQLLTHPGLWSGADASFEERINHAVTIACRHANGKAQREFLQAGES